MKKTLAFFLAASMLFSTALVGFAADATADYPVEDIDNKAYLVDDDDNGVDMTEDVDMVPYGETVYFPLLNGASGDKTTTDENAKKIYDAIVGAFNRDATGSAVENNHTQFYTDYVDAIETAAGTDDYNGTQEALKNKDRDEIVGIVQDIINKGSNESYYTTAGTLDGEDWAECQTARGTENIDKADKYAEYLKHQSCTDSGDGTAICDKGDADNCKTYRDVYSAAEYSNAYTLYNSHKDCRSESDHTSAATIDEGKKKLYDAINADLGFVKRTWEDDTSKFAGSTSGGGYSYKDTDLCKVSGLTSYTRKQIKDIIKEIYSKGTGYYQTTTSTGFKYVYEKAAAGNMKVSKKWEEGSSFVRSISVVRKKISADSYSIVGAQNDSSKRYLYFLAIEIKESSVTSSNDLFGSVTIEQNGNSTYAEVDEIDFDVNIELGYESASASNTEGEIPITPATFRDGNGFDEDSEFEFSFEADSDSYFIVNTNGQGRIVLAMNTDFDDDIGDDNPDADLYFFNGNYATFNRMGELYLANEDDDLYVYSIDEDGDLTRVDADYDDMEEAYVIRTRTLGRYVLSDIRLSTSSNTTEYEYTGEDDDIGTGSGSGSGAGSGSGGTTYVPSYTPPASSYTPPASSYAPPASSAPAEPDDEEPEDEPEEDEEPEEDPEEDDELDEDEDVVDVVVDDEENEGPEEKEGLSGLAWTLIIGGLAAVPVAIGAVYYIQNRPSKREFFDDDDDDDDE